MTKTEILNFIEEQMQDITILQDDYFNKTDVDLDTELINAKTLTDETPKYSELKKKLFDIEREMEEKFEDVLYKYFRLADENKQLNSTVNEGESRYSTVKTRKTNLKNQSAGTEVLKRNVYDTGILDNMFVIYYFLSYGIIGIFIYKLLKQ